MKEAEERLCKKKGEKVSRYAEIDLCTNPFERASTGHEMNMCDSFGWY
jgi:hypothetical protein